MAGDAGESAPVQGAASRLSEALTPEARHDRGVPRPRYIVSGLPPCGQGRRDLIQTMSKQVEV
ncbi:MAG: hypothetical protein ABJC51_07850, partial [Acidobacteriota bacterium]